jgi:hypothetical protein
MNTIKQYKDNILWTGIALAVISAVIFTQASCATQKEVPTGCAYHYSSTVTERKGSEYSLDFTYTKAKDSGTLILSNHYLYQGKRKYKLIGFCSGYVCGWNGEETRYFKLTN